MTDKPTLILIKSSPFWLVMGILFSSSVSLPVITLIQFIPKESQYIVLRSQIFSITNLTLIVFYFFIIKSYFWFGIM